MVLLSMVEVKIVSKFLPADKYIKAVQKDAIFFEHWEDYATRIYYPCTNEEYAIEIDGVKYNSVFSNKYSELVKFYDELFEERKKHGIEQITLF